MLDELEFRNKAEAALESLKQSLFAAEDSADIEVEDQSGALHISFEDGPRFVVSPNAPVRQIWVSAMARGYKLPWSPELGAFALDGEPLPKLLERLTRTHLAS